MTSRLHHRERVALPGRETDIRIGEDLRATLWAEATARFPRARRFGLVGDARVLALWPPPTPPAGLDVVTLEAPAGEAAKRREVLAALQDGLLDLTRDDGVVALGGGAVLDVAGFAAATVRRGLPWMAVPTTVVAMADASVGGKVAINHPRGKNLLGTFHPPALVLADVAYLGTLDARDVSSGLAELYKVARIGDAELLRELRRGAPASPEAWARVLARSVAVKARIVERDERDRGPRRLLNYGHTLGHALEGVLGGEVIRHGEAVAVGMAAAARLARGRGRVDDAWVAAQDGDLARLGLAIARPEGVAPGALLAALGVDKKRRPGSRHVFVLPDAARGLEVVEDVEEAEIRAAWDALPGA